MMGGFITFMIFIVTALMIEAAPIIEHFKLKKDMSSHSFPIYKNNEIILIIGGVGKVKSAMAVVYLFSVYGVSEKHILLNIGFCGTNDTRYDLGNLVMIHKISDMDTGRDYYPDIFCIKGFAREAICCCSKPVDEKALELKKSIFCDMESAGIMEASKKFIYAHQVLILKIISDYLSPENLDKETLQNYLRNHIVSIEQIISDLKALIDKSCEFSLEEEKNLLSLLWENLKFSEAMKQKLFREVKRAKLKGLEPLKTLESFKETKVNSKVEGKKIFEQIIEKLKGNPF